ncbi:TetR family transcriptional regulator [Solirubrobacter sp. CPCC 204708]|uniref:TetR/AcrR family transcriptional regulator n=1 Tax=Solirubrobacter deserti TaxID=2282478 RepID=A0ABT4RRQ8_9ACTN|nr:TetR/AcrR family transcriptional regulator [Solirubrobacter deserti]MBE2319316.1 TetR family transcriptional regulator [Solirubrobacter deserti]MDA0141182.1 TetR/AcrR family transcriptional regulator [Solirubrobacter deserti]
MPEDRPTLRDRNRARARAEIVAAAQTLFVEQGYAETSVEQIAEAAGVAPRTVFRHFPRKDDIVFHRHAEQVGRFAELLNEAPAATPTLDAMVDALLALLRLDDPTSDGTMLRVLDREPELQRRDAALVADHHAAVVTFLRGRGADAQRAELLAGAFMGAMSAARRLVLLQPDVPPREHLAAAVSLLRGLDWPAPSL